MRKSILVLIISVFFIFLGCKDDIKDLPGVKGKVSFSFDAGKLKSQATDINVGAIVVSITDGVGNVLYDNKKLDVSVWERPGFGDSYLSSQIELAEGEYYLTSFLVLNTANKVVYASPKTGSLKAGSDNFLPQWFNIVGTYETKLVASVYSTANSTAATFGYSSFMFDILDPIKVLISAKIGTVLTTATVKISTGAAELNVTKTIGAIIDTVSITGGQQWYKVQTYKTGYDTVSNTYTNSQLLAFQITPLAVTLTPTATGTANWYVSPTGLDSNSGTIGAPFKTLSKAWSVVSAGQLIYMRGGTYAYTAYTSCLSLTGKSGTSITNRIRVENYPGETPTLDYSGCPASNYKQYIIITGNYLLFKGIKLIGAPQGASGMSYGFYLNNCSYVTIERCEITKIAGEGLRLLGTTNNCLIKNCDSHHNAGPLDTTPYGQGDGFHMGTSVGANNVFDGCRAYCNSDDGFDFIMCNSVVTIKNCWAFWNGFRPETTAVPTQWITGGDGDGFKGDSGSGSTVTVTYTNDLAVHNRLHGFDKNESTNPMTFINNTAIANRLSYIHHNSNYASFIEKNNTRYNNGADENLSGTNISHNSWQLYTIVASDFQSLDESQLLTSRQSDGSLPVITYGHPSVSGQLYNKCTGTYNLGYGTNLGCF